MGWPDGYAVSTIDLCINNAILRAKKADGQCPFTKILDLSTKVLNITDPLAKLKLLASGPLNALLPQFGTSSPLTNRLTISPFVPNNEPSVDLATLLNAATTSNLHLD